MNTANSAPASVVSALKQRWMWFIKVSWELYWDSCCSHPDRTGDVRSVIKVSDFYSARQWHSTAMYSEMFRPKGIEHEMLLCLPAGHLRTVRMIF